MESATCRLSRQRQHREVEQSSLKRTCAHLDYFVNATPVQDSGPASRIETGSEYRLSFVR